VVSFRLGFARPIRHPSHPSSTRSPLVFHSQDVSDNQWNTFRSNIPILFFLTLLWLATSFLYRRLFAPSPFASASTSPSLSPPPRTAARTTFILAFAFPLLLILHGSSLPKMLVILVANFQVSRMAGWGGRWTKAVPAVGWAFNLGILFANEIYRGYSWGSLAQGLAWLVSCRLGSVTETSSPADEVVRCAG